MKKLLAGAAVVACLAGFTVHAAEMTVAHPMSLPVQKQSVAGYRGYTYTCENAYYGWCYAYPAPVGSSCYCGNAYRGFYGYIQAYYN